MTTNGGLMDLARPLHYFLGDRGSVLATRVRGREAAQHLRELAEDPGPVLLDFEGVEVASVTFLQELIDAVQNIVQADNSGRIVIGVNMNDDVSESLASVLQRKKLMIPYLHDDAVTLLEGKPQFEETLRAAQRLKWFTAPELAKKLEIRPDTATNRLKKLLVFGAVERQDDPEAKQGVRHKYRAATAEFVARSTAKRQSVR
jgi:hypothetical protein